MAAVTQTHALSLQTWRNPNAVRGIAFRFTLPKPGECAHEIVLQTGSNVYAASFSIPARPIVPRKAPVI